MKDKHLLVILIIVLVFSWIIFFSVWKLTGNIVDESNEDSFIGSIILKEPIIFQKNFEEELFLVTEEENDDDEEEEDVELDLDFIEPCNAGNYIGEEKTIEGEVVDTYRSDTNTIFLNFENPYPNNCFTAVIFSSDILNFPDEPENYYYKKIVRISGEIKEYEGKPEIILEDVVQIEIV